MLELERLRLDREELLLDDELLDDGLLDDELLELDDRLELGTLDELLLTSDELPGTDELLTLEELPGMLDALLEDTRDSDELLVLGRLLELPVLGTLLELPVPGTLLELPPPGTLLELSRPGVDERLDSLDPLPFDCPDPLEVELLPPPPPDEPALCAWPFPQPHGCAQPQQDGGYGGYGGNGG